MFFFANTSISTTNERIHIKARHLDQLSSMGSFPPPLWGSESLSPSVDAFATESSNASRNKATVNLSVRNTTKELVFREAIYVGYLNRYQQRPTNGNVQPQLKFTHPPQVTRLSTSDMKDLTLKVGICKWNITHILGKDHLHRKSISNTQTATAR